MAQCVLANLDLFRSLTLSHSHSFLPSSTGFMRWLWSFLSSSNPSESGTPGGGLIPYDGKGIDAFSPLWEVLHVFFFFLRHNDSNFEKVLSIVISLSWKEQGHVKATVKWFRWRKRMLIEGSFSEGRFWLCLPRQILRPLKSQLIHILHCRILNSVSIQHLVAQSPRQVNRQVWNLVAKSLLGLICPSLYVFF